MPTRDPQPEQLPLDPMSQTAAAPAPDFPPSPGSEPGTSGTPGTSQPATAPETGPTLTQTVPGFASSPASGLGQPVIEIVDSAALQTTTGVTAGELQAELVTINTVQHAQAALEVFQLRAQLLESCRKAAIRATSPEDWVLMKDRRGVTTAMLCGAGADKVAMYYGIRIGNFRPEKGGVFQPHRERDGDEYRYVGWCDAYSTFTGQGLQSIECGRSSSEQFIGRSGLEGTTALVAGGDMRASVYRLMNTKPVRLLCAMARVPMRELDEAWPGTGKTSADCRKGSGFGSSGTRGASASTDADVQALQAELRDAMLALVDNDKVAAVKLLGDVTEFEGKGRCSKVEQITNPGRFYHTWKRLSGRSDVGKPVEDWVALLGDRASNQAKDGVKHGAKDRPAAGGGS